MDLHRIPSRHREFFVWSLLGGAILASYVLAFALKLGVAWSEWAPWFGRGLLVVLLVKVAMFAFWGLHHGMWRYAGLSDLITTLKAVSSASALIGVILLVAPAPPGLMVLVALDWLLSMLLVNGVRISPRLFLEWGSASDDRAVVVIGAGDAGEAVVRELARVRDAEFRPVAFVDDDPTKQNRRIRGVPVLGRIEDLPRVVKDTQATALVLAICGLPRPRRRAIRALAKAVGIPLKRIPTLTELLAGSASIDELRDFSLEELLEREPIRTDRGPVDALLAGRTVLVTGAAGSIGSELCRQILAHEPKRLVLVDQNENALFEIEHELRAEARPVECIPVLCSVQDETKLASVFGSLRPKVVFHAAAYKHVPVLEHFPEEAVRNNVHGTRVVAGLADRFECERFVLISTDKAVRPTSVMGTTKRVAELIVGALDRRSRTRFTTLRFGNVLGSNGSVMQLFRSQIARGGPITVTHPDMRRFFMSIPEAVELVLFAAAMDEEGSTFILDMGQQVRILDLARHFIRLSGLEPERDIPIEIVGLRPGEKLYEELWTQGEEPVPTKHPSILRAPRSDESVTELERRVQTLIDWADEGARPQVIEHLRSLVPEFSGEPVCLTEQAPVEADGPRTEALEARWGAARIASDFSSDRLELIPAAGVAGSDSRAKDMAATPGP